MAYLTKDQYFKREQNAAKRNQENAEKAAGNGMSEQQQNAVKDLCSFRHDFHCNIDHIAVNDQDTRYKQRAVEINERLDLLGLPTIEGIPTRREDYLDIDDLCERIENAHLDGDDLYEKDEAKWVDDTLNEIKDMLYTAHENMEKCLSKIDKIYNTNFCPTGTLRIY